MRELSIEEICSVSGGIKQSGGHDWRDIGINSKFITINLGQLFNGMGAIVDKVAETVFENADIPPSQITPKGTCYSIPSVVDVHDWGAPSLPFIDILNNGGGERFGNLST